LDTDIFFTIVDVKKKEGYAQGKQEKDFIEFGD